MDKDKEFTEFYSQNYEKVYKYVSCVLEGNFVVEDVVQESFLEAWRRYDIIRNHPNKMGWLIRVACLKIRNMNKRAESNKKVPLDESMEELAEDEDSYKTKETELFLNQILSEEEWKRFRRYFLWGFTIDEMSKAEGFTKNNVSVRINRLINKLKDKILAVCFMTLMLGNFVVIILEKLT